MLRGSWRCLELDTGKITLDCIAMYIFCINIVDFLSSLYREDLTSWLKLLPPNCKKSAKYLKDILMNYTQVNKVGVAMADALQNVDGWRNTDPLSNWCDFKSDYAMRILERISEFASFCCGMIRWSFMLEPGRPRTELTVSC